MTTRTDFDKFEPLTDLRHVLEVATEFERTARDFYRDLAPKVGKNLRYLVEELAEEEQRHFDLFSEFGRRADLEEALKAEIERPASDRRFSDCVHLPDLGEKPDDQAVLQYAMMREHTAMEQYQSLAANSPAGPLRDLFAFLANEETKHKNDLEVLYYELVHGKPA